MSAILWLALGGIILTVGDLIFKAWTKEQSAFLYVGGLLVYLVGLICLVQSFKSENIAVASALFVIFNIVSLLLFSWFYFEERLSLIQLVGLAFALFAILLLELGK